MNDESPSYANPSGVRGICPSGWHLPSNEEWVTLDNYVNSDIECDSCAGTKLKVKTWPAGTFQGTSYPVGEDYYGWAGRAGGSAAAAVNSFANLGLWSNYWNASHNNSNNTYSCSASLGPLKYLATANCELPRVCLYSVRCIQDKEN